MLNMIKTFFNVSFVTLKLFFLIYIYLKNVYDLIES